MESHWNMMKWLKHREWAKTHKYTYPGLYGHSGTWYYPDMEENLDTKGSYTLA